METQSMKNHYFILRHGETPGNKKNIVFCWPEKFYNPLTEKGRKQIEKAAKELKKRKVNELRSSPRCADACVIDLIFSSDLLRTKQTAGIIAKELKIKPKFDKRLREVNIGVLNGKPIDEIGRFWDKEKKLSPLEYYKKRFKIAPPRGENYVDIEKRMGAFIKDIDEKYKLRNILIISHKRPLTLLEKVIYGYDFKKFVKIIMENKEIKMGEVRKLKAE